MRADIARARARLQAAGSIAVVSHERPDGDAVGSLLGLAISLRLRGQRAEAVLVDGVPGRFRFLPGAELVRKTVPSDVDLLVAVDCSDAERLGFNPDQLPRRPDINIDHHATNTRFAETNLVDPEASATAELLYDLAPKLRLPVEADVATNLLAGVVTDTIGFRTSSVTPKVLRLSAKLMELGASLPQVYEQTLNRHTFAALRYWGCGLSRLEQEDALVWAALTLDDRRRAGYPGHDDADLINLLSTVEAARVFVIFIEQPGGKTKVSWRSRDGIDVAALAGQFGGGGHPLAAGAMVDGEPQAVWERVLAATRAVLAGASGGDA